MPRPSVVGGSFLPLLSTPPRAGEERVQHATKHSPAPHCGEPEGGGGWEGGREGGRGEEGSERGEEEERGEKGKKGGEGRGEEKGGKRRSASSKWLRCIHMKTLMSHC